MKHLFELNEFDNENRIERIIKRINATGYISTSLSKEFLAMVGLIVGHMDLGWKVMK